jgi:hypothetical protein
MNSNQKIVLAIAALAVTLLLAFPPYDQHSIATLRVPIFAGFYFFLAPPQYGAVNTSMLLVEVFVVLINAGIGWLLLQDKPRSEPPKRSIGYQNAALLFAGINLVVILLFPPFESVFALTNAALPSFEGFYFVFGQRPNHTIVATLLWLELFFVLVFGALGWLIFKHRAPSGLTPEQAQALAIALNRKRG